MTLIAEFIRWFNEDDTFAESVITAVNEKGKSYFGHHRSGYVTPYIDLDEARDQLRTYTKAEFAQVYEEMTNNEYDEAMLHTAVSDSFRHAVVIDMSDPSTPVVLSVMDPRFAGMTEDYVFTWAGVAALAVAYPSMFVLHADTEDTMLFNIPVIGT
jgi:hypothetical protein